MLVEVCNSYKPRPSKTPTEELSSLSPPCIKNLKKCRHIYCVYIYIYIYIYTHTYIHTYIYRDARINRDKTSDHARSPHQIPTTRQSAPEELGSSFFSKTNIIVAEDVTLMDMHAEAWLPEPSV